MQASTGQVSSCDGESRFPRDGPRAFRWNEEGKVASAGIGVSVQLLRRPRKETHKFRASLSNLARPCLRIKGKAREMRCHEGLSSGPQHPLKTWTQQHMSRILALRRCWEEKDPGSLLARQPD